MSEVARTARALPALLKVGFASAVAYRAEFIVWFLAYTMPLIMLALWTAVAREAPVGRFGEAEFAAYFLAMLVVRLLTGSWVVWEMNEEIRSGTLSRRLLRPLHPLIAYACENLAAIPMRCIAVVPISVASLAWLGTGAVTADPVQLVLVLPALAGAWAMTFLIMAGIGTLGLYWESSLSLFDVWLGAFIVLSGYVMPLELLPARVRAWVDWLPFRYMLAVPVETLLGLTSRADSFRDLALQWTWVLLLLAGLLALWRSGLRRFAAYGG